MDRRVVLERLDFERRTLVYDGMIKEELAGVTRGRLVNGAQHWIGYSALNDQTAEGAIAREIEHHRRLGVAFEWKLFGHDRPGDLKQRLEGHGLRVGECEAVLVYELRSGGGWIDEKSEVRVDRIERVEQVEDYRRVNKAVYGGDQDPMADELVIAVGAGSKQHVGYVAHADDGEAVSIGRLYLNPESWFGGLYGGATAPGYRGRGFYRALVAARARDAAAAGARYLMVDARPTSRPILERLGFEWVTDTWPCEWSP